MTQEVLDKAGANLEIMDIQWLKIYQTGAREMVSRATLYLKARKAFSGDGASAVSRLTACIADAKRRVAALEVVQVVADVIAHIEIDISPPLPKLRWRAFGPSIALGGCQTCHESFPRHRRWSPTQPSLYAAIHQLIPTWCCSAAAPDAWPAERLYTCWVVCWSMMCFVSRRLANAYGNIVQYTLRAHYTNHWRALRALPWLTVSWSSESWRPCPRRTASPSRALILR